MTQNEPQCPEVQRNLFKIAVSLIGGNRAAARRLDCSERTVRDLISGQRDLHRGWLDDVTRLLRDHQRLCNHVARHLDPLFQANLTVDQRAEKPDGRRRHGPRTTAGMPEDQLPDQLPDQQEEERLMALAADAWSRDNEGEG